jgi:hypothetical protein
MANKKLTVFQKRVVLTVQKYYHRDIVVNGMTIASVLFWDTWKKNTQSHGRLVGRARQEVCRLDDLGFLNYHGGRDQWATFGASVNKRFICSNCKIEITGAVDKKTGDFHCLPCHHNQTEDPTAFAAATDKFWIEK